MKNYIKKINIKERTYKYSIRTILFIDSFPKSITSSVVLKQLLLSATSIGAYLVKAEAAATKKDFMDSAVSSLKSANETIYWLDILRNTKRHNIVEMLFLLTEAKEISSILDSSLLTAK